MKKLLALAFVTTLGMGVLSGCSKLEEKKSAAPTPAAPTAAPSAAPAPTAAPAPAADAGKIGVAECDDYMEKVKKCIDGKIPEVARATFKTAFDQSIDQWKKAAATPEGKSGLSMGCKLALDAAKQSMGSFGCEW